MLILMINLNYFAGPEWKVSRPKFSPICR